MATPRPNEPARPAFLLAGLGEVLWDMLPGGRQMGGAPANFACQAAALGAEARVVSRVGNDELGREIRSRLGALGVPGDTIETDPEWPTGTVTVEVDAAGQPQFRINENVAWDRLRGETAAREAAAKADAICFGSLAQRSGTSRAAIQSLLALAPAVSLRIFDVNLRGRYYSKEVLAQSLALANVLKVNDAELPLVARMLGVAGDERGQVEALASLYSLRLAALTRGERGSLLWAAGEWSDHPGRTARVVDTVGSGDAFTAAMTLGWLAKWDLGRVNEKANLVAAFVCSRAGATPELPDDLRAEFASARPVETGANAR